MPGDRHMDPTVRAARYEYQLGLDREPAEDWRSPRVGRGDPATCNALERASRFGNPSTEFILGWEEWLADVLLIACASSYVEDCLMVGVPPNHYAYTLIPHDETRKNLPPTCTRVMRSAVHGKIENVRLPTGGYLQPFYGPKTRLLTCLFLAKWSIENNWSFGLDPGRERNVVPSRQPTKLSIFKAFIEKKVKAAKRCSDGKPDPVAILDVLYEIGIDEIETAKGYAGRRGVRFHFEDHPKPVLFFGEQYMALHDYLREKHINENENRTDNKPSAWEQYFPGGQLIRTEEYTSRIAVGLQQCLDARAKFNIERYNLNRPIFVMGGLVVGDVNRGGGGPDVLDGSDVRAKSGVEGPTGGCPGSQDAKCGKAGRPLTIEVRKEGQLDDSGTSHLSPEVSGSHCDKAAKDLTGGNAGEPLAPGMPFDLVLPMASQESDTKTETSDRASASPGPPCPIPAAPIEASMMGIEKLPCPGDGADGLRRAKEANGRSAATSATGKSDEPVASKGPSNDEQPMSHQTEEYVSENLPAKVKPNRGGKYVTPCPKQDGSPDLCLVQGIRAKSGVEGPTGGCPGSQDAKCGKAGHPLTIEVRKEGQLDDSGTSHLSPEVSGSHCDKAAKDLTGGNAGEPLAPGMPFDLVLPMASQESDTKTETSDRASASPGPPCPIPAAPIEASMMGIEKLPCPGDGADGLRRAKEANGRSAATSATGKSDEPVASKGPSNDEQPMSHQTEEYVSENLPAKVKPNRGGKYVTPCPKQDGSPDLCLVQGIRAKSGVEGPTGGCPGSQDAKCGKAGRPLTIEVRKEGQLDDSGTSHLSPEVSGSHCDKAAKDLTGGNAGEPLAPGMPFDLVLPMASQESDTKTETSDRASASPGPPCPIPAAPIEASMMGIEKLPCPGDGADGLRRAKEANGRSAATSATGKSDEPVASKGPSNDEQPMSHQTEEYVSENLPAKVKPNRGGKYVTPCPKQDGSPDLCLVQGMLATASIPHHPSQQVPDAIIPCAPIFAWRVDKVDPIPCFDQSDANPEQTGATFSNPYENDSTNTKPSEKQHPDPCGARTAVGINPDSVATVVARALREILRAIEQLQIGINAFVEELRRSTRGLIDADHRLGVQGQQLDQAIEQHSPEAAALDDTRDDECPTLLGTREFLRRVKKPASPILRALPSPKVEQIDPSHNI